MLFISKCVLVGFKNFIYITSGNGPDLATPRAIQVFL